MVLASKFLGRCLLSAATRTSALALALAATGCVSTQTKPDSPTKVHISVGQAPGLPSPPAAPVNQLATAPDPRVNAANPQRPIGAQQQEPVPSAPRAPSITTTALAGLFAKYPYDGKSKTHYPRVAVTVIDWSRSDCWTVVATLWRSGTKSEAIPAFSVCPNKSLGFALNNAAKLHLFMEQSPRDHTGNVRTKGPKPPLIAIPDTYPMAGGSRQNEFNEFVQQLAVDTAWGPGAPTNIWIIGFDKTPVAGKSEAPLASR